MKTVNYKGRTIKVYTDGKAVVGKDSTKKDKHMLYKNVEAAKKSVDSHDEEVNNHPGGIFGMINDILNS